MKRHIILLLLALMSATCINAQEYLKIQDIYIPVKSIKSIKSSWQEHPLSLSKLLENDSKISIYTEALEATGLIDSLKCYNDKNYGFVSEKAKIDSCTWTNNALCIFAAAEYDNVAYPEERLYQHTLFAVPNSILNEKYGITNLAGLRAKAKQIYDQVYPEDASVTDEKDSRNSLNRFMAYHVLNIYGTYYTLTANDGCKLQNNFNRRNYDIRDWYETMMPHSMMKISFPSGSEEGLYINRRGIQSGPDKRGVFVRGSKVAPADSGPSQPNGVNGIYHYIDDIIAYDDQTQNVVFDDRIRMDASTLSPDFMTQNTDGEIARGHSCVVASNNGRYGLGGQGATATTNVNHCIGFKAGYARNFSYSNNTHIHVRNRVLGFWSYEGDEVTVKGPYDVTVKLPSVPAGTYEVRLMTCVDFTSRGIIASYIDGKAQGMPVDFRPSGTTLFGFQSDETLGDDEAVATFDQAAHNKGWMKGPGCYAPGEKDTFSGTTFRGLGNTVRRVLGHFTTDGKSDHYLRLKQLQPSGGELNFDFIELVPSSVYDNDDELEDRY